ncbi:hypothetical protein RB594_002717 [Gaeumannomyces avenae]
MNIFKSPSTSTGHGRPRPAHSIRGKISGPIPIPNPADDEEFPIRNPGSNLAINGPEEEFPIRQRGAGIASPTPLEEPPTRGDQRESQRSEALVPPPPANNSGSSSRNDDHGANGTVASHEPSPSMKTIQPSNPAPAPAPAPVPAVASTPPRMNTPTPPPAPTTTPATPPSQQQAAARTSPSSGTGTSPGHKRTNPSSTLRYSVVSNTSGNTADNRPQRKKSTLRGAFSKLFSRKKKNKTSLQGSGDETDRTSSVVPSTQHRSDTSALERVNEAEPKRSASLPITEYDRALRSHSVGPNDITAIESARNSMHIDAFTGGRRRAVTATHSNVYGARNFHRRHDLGEWGGLSPRPVSSHARGSRLIHPDEDPTMIGRAITSDIAGEYAQKRRSRSLSGLDLPGIPGSSGGTRRRSDEIRYWRESYGPSYLSPLSSTHPENEGGDAEFNDNDDTGMFSVDPSQAPSTIQQSTEAPPKTPPQPFNFGSFATMNEMAGMKITQAVGLDERMGSLESRTHRLERVVDQLCHSVPGFKGPMEELATGYGRGAPRSVPVVTGFGLPAPPPGVFGANPSAHAAIPRGAMQAITLDLSGEAASSSSRYSHSRHSAVTTEGNASRMSFGDGQTFIGSMHPPSSAATHTPSIPAIPAHPAAPSSGLRPTSTSTVRGATSLPALAAAAGAHEHHVTSPVDALAAQLEAERAARVALEVQVKKLSERMNTLSSTMYAMLRDPHKSRSQERLTPSRSHERLSPASAAVAGDSKLPGVVGAMANSQSRLLSKPSAGSLSLSLGTPSGQTFPPVPQVGTTSFGGIGGKPPIVKTLSVFESDGEDSEHEDGSVFQTPREEQSPHPYGAFGEDLRDETDDGEELDPRRKKAARTLSLSQLTLGPGVQGNVI